MSTSKTERLARETLSDANLPLQRLYTLECLKWRGKAKDTGRILPDVLAEELLRHPGFIKSFDEVVPVQRTRTYLWEHNALTAEQTLKPEPKFAKRLFEAGLTTDIGTILDYEVPINEKRGDGEGEIDLISWRGDSILAIELKYADPGKLPKEGMLRAAMEISTYYQLIQREKLIEECSKRINKKLDKIIKAVLLPEAVYSSDIDDLTTGRAPFLRQLMKDLKIELYVFDYDLSTRTIDY